MGCKEGMSRLFPENYWLFPPLFFAFLVLVDPPKFFFYYIYIFGALLLFTPIYLLQVPNQLLDTEYSSIWYTVQYRTAVIQHYRTI